MAGGADARSAMLLGVRVILVHPHAVMDTARIPEQALTSSLLRIARTSRETRAVQACVSRAIGCRLACCAVVQGKGAMVFDATKTLLAEIDLIAAFAENRETKATVLRQIAVVAYHTLRSCRYQRPSNGRRRQPGGGLSAPVSYTELFSFGYLLASAEASESKASARVTRGDPGCRTCRRPRTGPCTSPTRIPQSPRG